MILRFASDLNKLNMISVKIQIVCFIAGVYLSSFSLVTGARTRLLGSRFARTRLLVGFPAVVDATKL